MALVGALTRSWTPTVVFFFFCAIDDLLDGAPHSYNTSCSLLPTFFVGEKVELHL